MSSVPQGATVRTWIGRLVLAAALVLGLAMRESAAGPQLLQAVPGTPAAPDFALPDLDGEITRLSDFRGKVIIVNFWATWCPPCREEIPSMQRAWNRLEGEGVIMLAVHVGGNEDRIWTFATDFGVAFPILIDKTSSVSRAWRTIGLPTTFVVDPKGRKVLRAIGGRQWDDPALIETILSLRK